MAQVAAVVRAVAAARPTPKAKAKAQTKAKARPQSTPRPIDIDLLNVQEPPTRRRRIVRRDTDEQTDRVMGNKVYPTWPKEMIDAIVADDGQTPRDMIEAEVRRTRGGAENFKAIFWKHWKKEVGLDSRSRHVDEDS